MSRHRRSRRALRFVACLGVGGILAAHCGRAPEDPALLPVAEIAGQVIRRAELEVYLAQNLVEEGPAEPESAEDLDRVRSRLFDNFLDERILLAEADRRRVQVTDQEVNSWLESGGEGLPVQEIADPLTRQSAHRELRIQKLREAYARSQATVTPEEVETYLAEHRPELEPIPRLWLRRAVFPSESEARRAYEALHSRRLTFDQIAGSAGPAGGDASPVDAVVGQVPQATQAAIRRLRPGEISLPVEVEEGYALFRLEVRTDEAVSGEEVLREKARETLLAERYQQAVERLLEDLRRTTPVSVFPQNLPFPYVREDGG